MNKLKKNNVVNFPSNLSEAEREIEAILFAAAEPLDIETIQSKVSKKNNVLKILEKLQQNYSKRGINLVCISNRWSFRTAQNLSKLMSQQKSVEKKLSQAAIETLAIIVYHQPVTRAEIEDMRGISVSQGSLEVLLNNNWVEPKGHKNIPGRPSTWRTTKDFLDHFGLASLKELPGISELKSAGLLARNIGPSVLNRDNISEL